MKTIYLLIFTIAIVSCSETANPEEIISQSIANAGGSNVNNTDIEFLFRDIEYGAKHQDGHFEYVRIFKNDSSDLIRDVLTNDGFYREINGEKVAVADSMAQKYSNSINSVIYFALLPIRLDDKAVNHEYIGESEIEGQTYHKIKVFFDEAGGGTDHEDVFVYLFNKESNQADYLGYSYKTEGGGMRFREAYNERYIGGIRFVDYINYKPKSDIELLSLDNAYINNELDTVSTIALESIKVNPLQQNLKK